LSGREADRYARLIVSVSERAILSAIPENRILVVSILSAVLVLGLLLLAYYQNQINKKISLLHNEAEFKAIFESSTDGIISLDSNGIVKSWNFGAEEMFGFSARAAVGKSVFELFLRNDSQTLAQSLFYDVFH